MQTNSSRLITQSPSSPSFNSYSSGKLAEIAARVVQEISNEDQSHDHHSEIFSWKPQQPLENQEIKKHQNKEQEEEEEEFEFAILCREPVESPISADDIFYNGQIRPIYPLFNTSLLLDKEESKTTKKPTRLPLRKLFSEERESSSTSCSSSEADDLENVPAESYCVWNPKKDMCKKSSSTGSSKRWKFRELLYRSHSDDGRVENNSKEGHSNIRAVKEGDKRRSFLPYRQDLVGIFSNVNGFTKNLHPF